MLFFRNNATVPLFLSRVSGNCPDQSMTHLGFVSSLVYFQTHRAVRVLLASSVTSKTTRQYRQMTVLALLPPPLILVSVDWPWPVCSYELFQFW